MLGFKLFGSGLSDLAVSAIGADVGTGLTATGSTQTGALALVNCLNAVSTVATGAGVLLYSGASAGDWQLVYNGGANALSVYPKSGAKINALATNAAISLPVNTASIYFCMSSTLWVGILSA